MKSLIALALTLLTSASYAETYRVKASLCGEIDPFVIGDACVFTLENKQEELVLLTDEAFLYDSNLEIEEGHFVELDKNFISAITGSAAADIRNVLGRNLSFRRGTKFYSLYENSALNLVKPAQTAVNIACHAEGGGEGFLAANIKLSATLEMTGEFAQLAQHKFEYQLLDGDSVWSAGQASHYALPNYLAYRPQVYVGMDKFSFYLYDRNSRGFGEFDIILPVNAIKNGKKQFYAYVIMTAIDDHHGDTAALECQAL